jgi:hypothetical protein
MIPEKMNGNSNFNYIEGFHANKFCISSIVISLRDGTFQGSNVGMVYFEVRFSIFLDGCFFRQTDTAVFQRSKYGGRYIIVVGYESAIIK